jgi:hypothetical protein
MAFERQRAAFIESEARKAAAFAGELFDGMIECCESPIEKQFFAAAIERGWWAPSRQHSPETIRAVRDVLATIGPATTDDDWPWGAILSSNWSFMVTQLPVAFSDRSMRLDFALYMHDRRGEPTWLNVEVDGHDFHERTKEQARRDRSRDRCLTRAGWRVLRFTGSEIVRDVGRCWSEVDSMIETITGRAA